MHAHCVKQYVFILENVILHKSAWRRIIQFFPRGVNLSMATAIFEWCDHSHVVGYIIPGHLYLCTDIDVSLFRGQGRYNNPGISATSRTLNLLSLLALVSYPRRPVFQIESENSSSYTRNAASDAHGDSICYISTFASVPAQNVTKQNWISRQTWFRFPI